MLRSVFITVLLVNSAVSWSCGIGKATNFLSFILSLPSDIQGVNKCCLQHDNLVEYLHIAREEADRIFCNCLENNPEWWVQNIVKPVFCQSVSLYTWFGGQTKRFYENDEFRAKFAWRK